MNCWIRWSNSRRPMMEQSYPESLKCLIPWIWITMEKLNWTMSSRFVIVAYSWNPILTLNFHFLGNRTNWQRKCWGDTETNQGDHHLVGAGGETLRRRQEKEGRGCCNRSCHHHAFVPVITGSRKRKWNESRINEILVSFCYCCYCNSLSFVFISKI